MNDPVKLSVRELNVFFGAHQALRTVSLEVPARHILGIIGPAGSGKTAFLRSLNRMNDLHPQCRVEGRILLDGEDVLRPDTNVVDLRRRVGMLFALPVALPMTIFNNITYGPRLAGVRKAARLAGLVEQSLRAAFLWDEVKDRLHTSALRLSGGQQQRLCLARVLAMEPEVILLDEPCSGLDPISTAAIEEAMIALKDRYTFILVTNNTKQASRVADQTAFFLQGELIEFGATPQVFMTPGDARTSDYISGRFG